MMAEEVLVYVGRSVFGRYEASSSRTTHRKNMAVVIKAPVDVVIVDMYVGSRGLYHCY